MSVNKQVDLALVQVGGPKASWINTPWHDTFAAWLEAFRGTSRLDVQLGLLHSLPGRALGQDPDAFRFFLKLCSDQTYEEHRQAKFCQPESTCPCRQLQLRSLDILGKVLLRNELQVQWFDQQCDDSGELVFSQAFCQLLVELGLKYIREYRQLPKWEQSILDLLQKRAKRHLRWRLETLYDHLRKPGDTIWKEHIPVEKHLSPVLLDAVLAWRLSGELDPELCTPIQREYLLKRLAAEHPDTSGWEGQPAPRPTGRNRPGHPSLSPHGFARASELHPTQPGAVGGRFGGGA